MTGSSRRCALVRLPGVLFRDTWFKPVFNKYAGQAVPGVQLHVHDRTTYEPVLTALEMLQVLRQFIRTTFACCRPSTSCGARIRCARHSRLVTTRSRCCPRQRSIGCAPAYCSTKGRRMIRSFEVGDGPALAEAWTAAAPADPIGYQRFRDLFLLDRNFDPAGLKVAVHDDQVVGAAYAVRRLVAAAGDDLEPTAGWIPFFFVHPDHRGRGLGRSLVTEALEWLRSQGRSDAFFSSYTPNYFLPGLDVARYPAALRLLTELGFERQYDAVAMDRSLVGYEIPAEVRERLHRLAADGYSFGMLTGDELTSLIEIAGSRSSTPTGRGRSGSGPRFGLPLERIVVARDPGGGDPRLGDARDLRGGDRSLRAVRRTAGLARNRARQGAAAPDARADGCPRRAQRLVPVDRREVAGRAALPEDGVQHHPHVHHPPGATASGRRTEVRRPL